MISFYKSNLNSISSKSLTNKCIVLDLDETLVHTNENISELQKLEIMSDPNLLDLRRRTYQITLDDVVYKKGEGVKTVMYGITRPHVKEFLISCFSYFKVVIVWSAGKKKYVDAIVDFLFKDIKRPHIVYSYDQCEKTSNGLLVKPLSKLINNESGLSKYMSLENSFIIDDRNTVYAGFVGDNPDNGIQIPPYKPAFNIHSLRSDDIALKQLMTWLLQPEVMNESDVRKLDKSVIFKTNVTSLPYKRSEDDINIDNIETDDENDIETDDENDKEIEDKETEDIELEDLLNGKGSIKNIKNILNKLDEEIPEEISVES